MEHLKLVFKTLDDARLRLGYDKCDFMQDHIDLLGHWITHGEYKPLASRVEAITKIDAPKDVKGI